MSAQLVLDVCCGPRSFWFDKQDDRALFVDRRLETHATDLGTSSTKGRSPIVVEPDVLASFTALPFLDESFPLVVFDPPHAERSAALGFLTKRYGHLTGDWRTMLRHGFAECFRVLKPHGTLVFKWGENDYGVTEILRLSPHRPLFGHKTSKTTVWAVFIKPQSDTPTLDKMIATLGESGVNCYR